MADASYVQSSFLGGEWSKSMQGRIDRPDYRTALNLALNIIPVETGAAVRRSGTQVIYGATTRGGLPGRVIKFDFQQTSPYNLEFTDGHLRFLSGTALATTNDSVSVAAISAANPAVVQTSAAVTWASNDQAFFSGLGVNNPLLQSRVFTLTKVDTTHFSLADPVTGANIDGATLGAFVAGTINRVLDFVTPYVGGLWASLRVIQADIPTSNSVTPGAVLLQATIKPYVLQVTAQPTATAFATFSLAPANFKDGPYFDPVPGGTLATPNNKNGIINLTLSFNAYDATRAYSIGDYVTFSGVNYKSITDGNLNNQPDTHPANWSPVSSADAIGPNGFQGSDVGRMVRLFSEPSIWASGTTYNKGDVVAFGGASYPFYIGATYWQSLVASNLGNQPGLDTTKWTLVTGAAFALWSWGKITSLLNEIDRALAGSVNIGDMTAGGGLAAAFDGNTNQNASASAEKQFTHVIQTTFSSFVGKNYSGASAQKIQQGTIFPSNDFGFVYSTNDVGTFNPDLPFPSKILSIVLNLRAKASAPASSSDGTLLGSTTLTADTTAPVTVISGDQTTAWNFVWFEIVVTADLAVFTTVFLTAAEVKFFNPPGSGTGNGVAVQILGDPLLYTTAIRTWRLGLYSDTTGWPTCGTYHEGRLWLSGVIDNRFDASKSNDIFNFAPTDAAGTVAANNGLSYIFNSPDVNPILWMIPDEQGVIMGTKAGEWVAVPPTAGPISPTNIAARRRTTIGCANIEPRRTEHTTVFVQKFGRKIMEYFPDVFSGKFTAPHLTEKGKHLTAPGLAELAYQQELAPIVWARRTDGGLIGITYKRDTLVTSQGPTFAGAHRHALGSGRLVESIAVGPSVGGTRDALAMVTNDPLTGVRHVEIMQDLSEETTALANEWLLDDAVAPSSTVSTSTPSGGAPYGGLMLNGLWHLNGKTVTVFAGGLDCGDFTVANGSIFVPYGDGVSAGTGNGLFTAAFVGGGIKIVAGFTYTSQGQIVRPSSREESGARTGPALGKKRRSHQYAMLTYNAVGGISVGTDFAKLNAINFRTPADVPLTPLQDFDGVQWNTLTDIYSFDSMLCWQVTRPKPCNIVAIGAMLQTQDT